MKENLRKVTGRSLGLAMLVMSTALLGQEVRDTDHRMGVTLELTDGSRLVGTTELHSFTVETPYARIDVPLAHLLEMKMDDDHKMAQLELRNGDRIKGAPDLQSLRIRGLVGEMTVRMEHLGSMRISQGGGKLSKGDGPLAFGGVNWVPMRTGFEVQGDKLVSLPKAREGFHYGHGGNGRGATLMTNIGTADWRDYSMEFVLGMKGVDAAFNPHGLPATHRAGIVMFHVADCKESWNESGNSAYAFGIQGDGRWALSANYDHYCHQPSGYGNPEAAFTRSVAKGDGIKIAPEAGNKIRLDVVGKRIRIWVDGELVADVTDEDMGDTHGGRKLDHGGIGIASSWECMIWIRDFSVKRL